MRGVETHVVGRRNGNAVFLRVPAHVEDLLVKIDLIRIGLLAHALRAAHGAVGAATFLAVFAAGVVGGVHGGGNADFLGLEGALIGLEDHLGVFSFFGWVDHEVVVVRAGHDILGVAREDHLEFVEDAVILVRVA